MRFTETTLSGAFVIDTDERVDERGSFFRLFTADEFRQHGLNTNFVQSSLSHNTARGTLRGLHFQRAPKPEAKLVRCVRGAIYDVVVDLRPASKTYCKWFGIELSESAHNALYIPEGLAHGFLTRTDRTEVLYEITEYYVPELAAGVRWNDPAFKIAWPEDVAVISERDRSYQDFV